MLHLTMATALPRVNLNEQVYETLRQRVLRRDPGPGAKLSLHELATELGRLAQPRAPRAHATRLRGPPLGEGTARLLRHAGHARRRASDGYDVRLALELHAAERAVGVGRRDQPRRASGR